MIVNFYRTAVSMGMVAIILPAWSAQPSFILTPQTPTTFTYTSNDSSIPVKYLVTNHSKLTRTLTLEPVQGITQNSGAGNCGNPFTLAPNASCVLALNLAPSQLPSTLNAGPKICVVQDGTSNTPSPFFCNQPSYPDALHITQVAPTPAGSWTNISGSVIAPFLLAIPPNMTIQTNLEPTALLANKPNRLIANYYDSVGLLQTFNQGSSWSLNMNPASLTAWGITSPLQNADIIYTANDNDGVYKSIDGGVTWVLKNTGLTPAPGTHNMQTITVAPTDPSILFVADGGIGFNQGLFKSTDGADHWTQIPFFIGTNVNSLVVDAQSSDIIYAANSRGIYKSTDGAINWTRVLPLTNSGSVYISQSPFNPNVLFLAQRNGIYQTSDAGTTWTLLTSGLPVNVNATSPVVFVPNNMNQMFIAYATGVYRSTNSGVSWSLINNGFNDTPTNGSPALIADPFNMGVLYAGGNVNGVYMYIP